MLEILLISAGAVLETLFIMRSYKRRNASSVVLKTMASVVFVLLGLLELRRMGPSLYGWYVVAGLTLGMLGDLLLALRFLSEKLHRLFRFFSVSVGEPDLVVWVLRLVEL